MPAFTRDELIELRTRARSRAATVPNRDWKRAYENLADAADHLDAMIARSTVTAEAGPGKVWNPKTRKHEVAVGA